MHNRHASVILPESRVADPLSRRIQRECQEPMMKRLLITGAAGGLGKVARHRLAHMAEVLRLSDIADLGPVGLGEEAMTCDLGDAQAVNDLVKGCDGIVHFGGISVEDCFSKVSNANILGVYNLYEAARRNGNPRIFFASSNHTVGFYPQNRKLDAGSTFRPDGLYGVSKCFGEAMALMYHDKFGIETARVRIGSCFDKPAGRRMLATWLSRDDLVSLIECVFRVPRLGCPVIYGVSANDRSWWDNSAVSYIGWVPKDTAEIFRAEVEATEGVLAADDPAAVYQGGAFATDPIIEEDADGK